MINTYRRECLDGLALEVIPRQVKLGVVDRKTALRTVGASQERLHRSWHDTVISAVLGVLEVHVGNPVVGEVLGHLASRACCPLANITLHGRVERIAAHNHVQMGRGQRTGLGRGVEALGCQGRAWESETSVGLLNEGSQEAQSRERLHLDGFQVGQSKGVGRGKERLTKMRVVGRPEFMYKG